MSTESGSSKGTTTAKKITVAPRRAIEQFDGKEYPVWALHMRNLLRERGLLKYIEEQTNIDNYDVNEDAQALAEIQFTLSTAQTKLTLKSTTAHDTWERLKAKHLHMSESNLMFLKNQFTGLKMNNKETMSDYIARIDEMAEQISSLSEEVKDADKVVIFTRGLPETYRHVVVA